MTMAWNQTFFEKNIVFVKPDDTHPLLHAQPIFANVASLAKNAKKF